MSEQEMPEEDRPNVTFVVPHAGAGASAPIPNEGGEEPQATEPPLYAVVIHEGREVFYKRIGA
jgi:hypothetical protein